MIKLILLLKKVRNNFFSLVLLMFLLQVNSNVNSNFKKVFLIALLIANTTDSVFIQFNFECAEV